MSHKFLIFLIFAQSAFFFDTAQAASQRTLTVDDLYAIRDVGGPQISPDGSWLAYTISEVDRQTDSHRSDIWLSRWDGSETRSLTVTPESENTPRWSPDGTHLAFLSTGPDLAAAQQLWLIEPVGGTPEQLTSLKNGVSDFAWAPDSRQLVLVSAVIPAGKVEQPPNGPIVVDRMLFKRDGYGYLGQSRSRLHLLKLDDRSLVQLTDGPFDEILPSFSPDGKHIAYVTKLGEDPDRHENWDVLTVAPEANAKPQRVSQGDFMECDPVWGWNYASPSWSPDSKQLACIQSGDLKWSWFTLMQVAIFSTQGDKGRQPTVQLDRNTTYPRFSNDGQRLFFLLEDDQSVQLASVTINGTDLQRHTPTDGVVASYDLGPGGKIAVLFSTPQTPNEVAVIEDGKLRPLTRANADLLATVKMMKAEAVGYPTSDGIEVHGLLMKPPGFQKGQGYPTILRLHGGPVAQWQKEFDFTWQLLAAQGYVVFGPNPRGSSGRGEAFQKTIFGDWGKVDVQDILAAADYLVKAGIADPKRLGVGGWSAGAILTNYVIASDTRFGAATSGAGVSNMLAGWGTDEWWQDWEAELGLPWETPENWIRVSYPFFHANRIKTPTLFLAGSEDFNVPLLHSEQMYMALKRLGVATQLVVYPGQSHGISLPSFQIDILQRYLDWYAQWLQ